MLRVILDSRLRLPLDSRIVQTAKDDVVVFVRWRRRKRSSRLLDPGIQVEQVSTAGVDGRPDLQAICEALAEREITSVMIEGGAFVNWEALAAGVVDKVFLYYAPKILAGDRRGAVCAGPGFRADKRCGAFEVVPAASVWRGFCGGGVFKRSLRGRVRHSCLLAWWKKSEELRAFNT